MFLETHLKSILYPTRLDMHVLGIIFSSLGKHTADNISVCLEFSLLVKLSSFFSERVAFLKSKLKGFKLSYNARVHHKCLLSACVAGVLLCLG